MHYNCLLDATYYRKNLSKIKLQFVVPPEDNKIEEGRNSLFLKIILIGYIAKFI